VNARNGGKSSELRDQIRLELDLHPPEQKLAKKKFEEALERQLGAMAIAVNSGTSALSLAIEVCTRLRPGSIIASNLSHPSALAKAAGLGQNLVLVDFDSSSLNIDLLKLQNAVDSCGPVSAVIFTHVGGCMAGIEAVKQYCEDRKIFLIEDAAHAFGGRNSSAGAYAGSFGNVGCFSFHATKNFSTGEGGALITRDRDVFELAYQLHDLGRLPGALPYSFSMFGENLRISGISALIGLSKLSDFLERENLKRMRCVELLASLQKSPAACFLQPFASWEHLPHANWTVHFAPLQFITSKIGGLSAARFAGAMAAEGIEITTGWDFDLHQLLALFRSERAGLKQTEISRYRTPRSYVWIGHEFLTHSNAAEIFLEACQKISSNLEGLMPRRKSVDEC
jgi:dTDP-4-amino-4,6-dideoxygalactose transaminase